MDKNTKKEIYNMFREAKQDTISMINEAMRPKDMGCSVAPSEPTEFAIARVLREKSERRNKLIAAHSALSAIQNSNGPFFGITRRIPETPMTYGDSAMSPFDSALKAIKEELGALELS